MALRSGSLRNKFVLRKIKQESKLHEQEIRRCDYIVVECRALQDGVRTVGRKRTKSIHNRRR